MLLILGVEENNYILKNQTVVEWIKCRLVVKNK